MIRHTEVDGVPAVIAPSPGQLRAGLAFRVGRADETLARGGITHLIEHLTLHPLGYGDVHHNGSTGNVYTHFHVQGGPEDVATFLSAVCASLQDLPMARLEVEKDILRTEAASRESAIAGPLAVWRYGARGYGLGGFGEWGLPAFTPDHLRAWAAEYFTRENAVLWVAGDDIPAGLSLKLPAGTRRAVPAPTSALPVTPAWFPGSDGAVAWTAVVPRTVRGRVFAGVLQRSMYRSLRQESGLSYTVVTDYEPRGDGQAVITAIADALPEKQDAVLGGFVDVLAAMRVGRIDPADVTAVVGTYTEAARQPDADAGRLLGYALDLLIEGRTKTDEDLVADLAAVTPAAVAAAAREALDDGLLMTPAGRNADWAGFTAAPSGSTDLVQGTEYQSLDSPDVRLILSDEGVSVTGPDGAATVRFDACAAALAWPDGGRVLMGHDAITVRIEPTLYRGLSSAMSGLDAGIPAAARVDRPARDPDSIPRPDPAGPARATPATPGQRSLVIRRVVVLSLVALVFGGCGVVLLGAFFGDQHEYAFDLVLGVLALSLSAWFLRRGVLLLRTLPTRG